MGGAGVALPQAGAAGFYLNPAHLGFFGRQANVAVERYPGAADWLPRLDGDVELSSTAVSVGYDLSEQVGMPLSVGAGYLGAGFDFGFWNVDCTRFGKARSH